jgi:hypothetical protein
LALFLHSSFLPWVPGADHRLVSIIDRHAEKSAIKRDGPVFFSSSPVKVAGDENTIIAIVAPYRGEAQSEAVREGGKPT